MDLLLFFHCDVLSYIMIAIVMFVGAIVGLFSRKYMKGDTHYINFFINLFAMLLSVVVMVTLDNCILFLGAWFLSNLFLVRLIVHKSIWHAARTSGTLAGKNFLLGFVFLSLAFIFMYIDTGSMSIQTWLSAFSSNSTYSLPVVLFITLAAMTQSAIWPFHQWLVSSLNCPTPVSAIMHAGLINGGGFLLARFAHIYFKMPYFLDILLIVGTVTALIGTIWKLMQPDVKRMLAYSTMSQMGFMIIQCGLGLFPTAITHLCMHGFFKAYLFLCSGGAAREKRFDLGYPPKMHHIILSLCCGLLAAYTFIYVNPEYSDVSSTEVFTLLMVFIACSQLTLTLIAKSSLKTFPLSLCFSVLIGGTYGYLIAKIELVLTPLNLMHPQKLSPLNISIFGIFIIFLGLMFFVRYFNNGLHLPGIFKKVYVHMLNKSQPHPGTVTPHRYQYKYK